MDRYAAASYAPLIMYAWDMCDAQLHLIPPPVDPRITQKGWTIVGFLSAGDDIFKAGSSICTTVMGAGDRVCYGYVATHQERAEMVAVIRGTDGAQEWADDLVFLMQPHANKAVPGLVDKGFFSIYSSMYFHPVNNPNNGVPVVEGLKQAVGQNEIMVLGHSLGAAIGTYLTLDLNLAGVNASACLFASPRTGNQEFVDYFEDTVKNYDVFNYERDLVPTVPHCDILHLSTYRPLHQAKTIPAAYSTAAISDNPGCNHHLICYTALLDPATYQAEMANSNVVQDDRNCAKCVERPAVP